MNIGEVAELSGVPAKTIRYYESVGLIEQPRRRDNGYRTYSGKEVEQLRFISRARGLGFSVQQVGDLLSLYQDKNRLSAEVKSIALQHVKEIERKVQELEALRRTLLNLADHCHGDQRPDCPILDDLAAATPPTRAPLTLHGIERRK